MRANSRHTGVLYPVCRVRAKGGTGSGTVVYSRPTADGKILTFVITNHHVVSGNITVKKAWNPFLSRDMRKESRSSVEVEFFKYKNGSRKSLTNSVEADIVAYEKDQDMALLQLRGHEKYPWVAKMPPRGREREIQLLDAVYACGAALGHPPVVTTGVITYMDDEIEDYEYWMSNAPIIFGNSGGAVFLAKNREWIGIPSRVAITGDMFSKSAVTHLGFFIPFWRVYDWLESEYYHFIFDEEVDRDECTKLREQAQEEQRRFIDIQLAQEVE